MKDGVLVRDFQYAYHELHSMQREEFATDKLAKDLWQFKYMVNARKDVRPAELERGDKPTAHFVRLPVEGEIVERPPPPDFYPTHFKAPDGMCEGYPSEFLKHE